MHVLHLVFCNTHDGSMGRTVYLPIHEWLIFMVNLGIYTSPMDPMGYHNIGYIVCTSMLDSDICVYNIYIYRCCMIVHPLYTHLLYSSIQSANMFLIEKHLPCVHIRVTSSAPVKRPLGICSCTSSVPLFPGLAWMRGPKRRLGKGSRRKQSRFI